MFDLNGIDAIANGARLGALNQHDLRLVQRGLAICGQPISEIDGFYGTNTLTAWNGFQLDHGLPSTDTVNTATRNAIRDRALHIAELCGRPAPDKATVKNSLRAICADMGLSLPTQMAYVLATANWETNSTFKPVREAYWIPNAEEWRRTHLTRYYPFYGRGYVQLTWQRHYKFYGDVFGLDLVARPDDVMRHDMSAFVIVHGFKMGRFTGHKLVEFVSASRNNFTAARACINGTDQAANIAKLAQGYLNGATSVTIPGKGNITL
jgi:hypothetical protein